MLDSSSCSFIIAVCLDICSSGIGKITDETGQKIVAASVFVPRKSFGTISDIDGNYQLSVGKKDTVYVSIAGYEKQKICVSDYAVENGKLMIDVLLQSLK